MNALAEELNEALAGTAAERLLSDMGKRMYFPKGIVSQSAEADERAIGSMRPSAWPTRGESR